MKTVKNGVFILSTNL